MGTTATPANAWKGKRQVFASPLDLPSGNTALVKSLDPTAFLTNGLIPNPLMEIIRKSINSKKGLPPSAMTKMTEDPAMLTSTLLLFDRVLTNVVVEPAIKMPPPCIASVPGDNDDEDHTCGEYADDDVHSNPTERGHHAYSEGARDEDVLYADQVDMEDKIFIFQWCLGGTRDLQKFREEQRTNMGTIQSSQDAQVPA